MCFEAFLQLLYFSVVVSVVTRACKSQQHIASRESLPPQGGGTVSISVVCKFSSPPIFDTYTFYN